MIKLKDITLLILASLPAVFLCACASDDGPSQPASDDSTVTLKFNIFTQDRIPTRTIGVWEEEAASIGERILSPDDMRVMIFDESGSLITTVTPAALDWTGTSAITGDGFYTLTVSFTSDYFDSFTSTQNVPFSLMILANMESAGGHYYTYEYGKTKIQDITDRFRMNVDYYPTETTGIPMFGLKYFNLSKSSLAGATSVTPNGEIDLLRAMCKIEVSNSLVTTKGPDDVEYPLITGVEMTSWNPMGYVRPLQQDNSSGNVTKANVFPAAPDTNPKTLNVTGSDEFKYRVYCPEAPCEDVSFRVKAILTPGGNEVSYDVCLSDYTDVFGPDLIRNHIYRFNISKLGTMAAIDVEVMDWTLQTDEYEFDNVVSMEPDGFLKWSYTDTQDFAVSTETYNGKPEQQLSILNGTTGYATGTFKIISPRGATWSAYFIPGENGVDAFEFVNIDSNGNETASAFARGNVGEEATIRIRGKGEADPLRHWAELVVEVRTADGNVLLAPLTPAPAMSTRYIIYRENKL